MGSEKIVVKDFKMEEDKVSGIIVDRSSSTETPFDSRYEQRGDRTFVFENFLQLPSHFIRAIKFAMYMEKAKQIAERNPVFA